jgi:phage-related protein
MVAGFRYHPNEPMTRRTRTGESEDPAPREDKPLAWLAGEVKTPPLSSEARQEAGVLLRRLQRGEGLSLPESRPMPSIGPRCHELRVDDAQQKKEWRVMYYVGRRAIAVLDVFQKTTRATPAHVIDSCRRRLAEFRKVDES